MAAYPAPPKPPRLRIPLGFGARLVISKGTTYSWVVLCEVRVSVDVRWKVRGRKEAIRSAEERRRSSRIEGRWKGRKVRKDSWL